MTTKLKFNHPKYSDEKLNQSVSEILEANTLFSLASIKDGKESWINTSYFSFTSNLEIYCMTYPTAQHTKNVEKNPSVALSIFDSHQSPTDRKRGLQIFGTCRLAKGLEIVRGIATYSPRFPWLKKYISRPEDFAKKVLTSRFYIIHPRVIKIFDEKLFGEETWVTVNINS